jgi:predicted dehydrogenase
VDACLRGKVDETLDATFEDGLAAQLAMSALMESQQSERWVSLDEV